MARRNGTTSPSFQAELLPLRSPFCHSSSLLAYWSRLTVSAARTLAGEENDMYCMSSEHKKSAAQRSVKLLRVRALIMENNPRDPMVLVLRSPIRAIIG